MTQHLNDNGLLFTRAEEPGFELPSSPGVTVRPLLTKDGGHVVDVFFMSLEPGAEVTPESHPFSETLVVLDGQLDCSIEDGNPIEIGVGQMWHTVSDKRHHVRNIGNRPAEVAMLIGV
jgi:quercetin dioxygenase-like cupin family protein